MRNVLVLVFLGFTLAGCPAPKDDSVTPANGVNIPELGEYRSFIVLNSSQFGTSYNILTSSWDWKIDPTLKVVPSAFGALVFKKNGSYEFTDLKKSGTYKFDANSKKILFKGFLEGVEGFYKIQEAEI